MNITNRGKIKNDMKEWVKKALKKKWIKKIGEEVLYK